MPNTHTDGQRTYGHTIHPQMVLQVLRLEAVVAGEVVPVLTVRVRAQAVAHHHCVLIVEASFCLFFCR